MRYVMVEKVPSERSAITERKTGNGEKSVIVFIVFFLLTLFNIPLCVFLLIS